MDEQMALFDSRWKESVEIGNRADARLGAEKYAAEVLKDPIADLSTAAFAERDAIRAECKTLAGAYITAHRDDLARFEGLGIEHLVNLITIARHRGDEDERILIDMWLLANFEPQRIRGNFRAPAPGSGRRR